MAPKRKMAKNLDRIDRHRPKIFLNPNFLVHIQVPTALEQGTALDREVPIALEQGQICIRGIMGKISPGKKFLRF